MTGLQRWLNDLGLGQYADLLAANNIDREVLPNLDDGDLAKLGIPFEHRKKLIEAAARHGVTPPQTVLGGAAQPPQGAASLRAERRHLTVLFCDVVGSTALSARLDPEDLRAILYQFQSCCGDAIQRYDGHIFRLMGDGVLAYFGYPTAHEDDAERAVNAALQILQSISAVTVPGGQHIDVRIGIATGLVVVGDLIGEGVNLGSSARRRTWRHLCSSLPAPTRFWWPREPAACSAGCSISRRWVSTASPESTGGSLFGE